ncbi:MAG: hypothetical protein LBP52_10705, partial [Burkholderiaceae bacterium]|nr:hypothetical protein [Burkholderiaceae bacterium]
KFVGIDVSKATLDVHIDTDKKSLRVDYDDAGLARIVECLREAAPTLVVMEATGDRQVRAPNQPKSSRPVC